MGRISIIKQSVCIGLVSLLATAAYGQSEVRMGGSVADAMAGNNVIIGSAGGNVTVFFVLTDSDAAGLGPVRTNNMAVTCDAFPIGVTTGTVTMDKFGSTGCGDYIAPVPAVLDTCGGNNPGFCDNAPPIPCVVDEDCPPLEPAVLEFFASPCVNQDNPDYIFAGVSTSPAVNTGPCPGGLPRGGSVTNTAADAQPCGPGQACYLIEFSYAISQDATGDHGVTLQNPDLGEGPGPYGSFLRAYPLANILFDFDDPGVIIRIPTGACCGDVGCIADGINETECDALGGSFNAEEVCNTQCLYGDITSPAGLCIPDCTGMGTDIDFDDILCALNGFANASDCPCADIAGAVETVCIPDGIIDFDDILVVIKSFSGDPTCPDPCSNGG